MTEICHWIGLCYSLFFITVLLVVSATYNHCAYGIRKYPGPFLASVTDIWRLYDVIFHRDAPPMRKLHEKYGEIVRYGPNILSFSNPKALRDIYARGDEGFPKSKFYASADFYIAGVKHSSYFGTRDEEWHAKMRRALGSVFSMTSVTSLEMYVDHTIKTFISTMGEKFADRNESVEIVRWIQFFTFDVLGQLMYGQPHGFLDKGEDIDDIIEIVDFRLKYGMIVGQMPWLDHFFIKNPLILWLEKKGFIKLLFSVVPFAKRSMTERAVRLSHSHRDATPPVDLLGRMIATKEKHPDVMNDIEIVKMCGMLVFPGSDTTAITITTLFYHLLKHPSNYTTLRAEIDAALPSPNTTIPFAQAQALPYLDACIKEILRIHPATAFNLERVVPAGGRTILGHFIPAGTIVAASPWTIHLDTATFGPDAAVFRPERWLEDEGRAKEMWRSMLGFGAGNHLCLGRNVALMEMYKLIPVWVRSFEMELVKPDEELKLKNSMFAKPRDFKIRLTRR